MPGRNDNGWNETLRFSWGHIIAFVFLVFICYVIFMGVVYWSGGNFPIAVIVAGANLLALFATSMGAQLCKATDRRFSRYIVVERILVCSYIVVFIAAMVPYNHFWGVLSKHVKIEEDFKSAITASKTLFDRYDEYAEDRINKYKKRFSEKDGKRESYIRTLELQLRSENYNNLKTKATKWIDESSKSGSVWNAFLFGNIEKIDTTIIGWDKKLAEYSNPKLSNEGSDVKRFSESFNVDIIHNNLNSLQEIYTDSYGLKLYTFLTAILLFLAVLLPYVLQLRNTKAQGFIYLLPFKVGIGAASNSRMVTKSVDDEGKGVNNDDEGSGDDADDIRKGSSDESNSNDLFDGTF